MTLVLDASVAVKWMFVEPGSEEALKLAASGEELIAPDLVLVECANAAWKRLRRAEISVEQATAAVETWPGWFSELLPSRDLLPDGLALARELDHPIYDCLYLVAAARHDVRLVTADARLIGCLAGTRWQDRIVDLARLPPLAGR